jgi:hypothetical protein
MTSDGPRRPAAPVWAQAVIIVGWLVVVLAILFFVICVIGAEANVSEGRSPSATGPIIATGAMSGWIAGFGLVLVVTGRSRRASAASTRLHTWAKVAIIVGIMLSVGMPVFLGGGLISEIQLTDDSVRRGYVLLACIVIGGASFVAGALAIAAAIIWGRRRKAPDVSHVFN